jgi:hypothetical protein
MVSLLEGVSVDGASRLLAELVTGQYAQLATPTRSFLCLELGVVSRARGERLRFDDPDASEALFRTGRVAVSALCAVISALPRVASVELWEDYALVFEHAIEKAVVQVTALPIVQDVHFRLMLGATGAAAGKQWRGRSATQSRTRAVSGWIKGVGAVLLYLLVSLLLQPFFFLLFALLPDLHGPITRRVVLNGRPLCWITDPWLRLLMDRLATILLVALLLAMPATLNAPDLTHKAVWALLLALGLVGTEVEELLYVGILRSPVSAAVRFLADEWNLIDALGIGCALAGIPWYIAVNVRAFDSNSMLPETLGALANATGLIDANAIAQTVDSLAGASNALQDLVVARTGALHHPTLITDGLLAIAVFALTIRQMRLLYLSREVGPYVQVRDASLPLVDHCFKPRAATAFLTSSSALVEQCPAPHLGWWYCWCGAAGAAAIMLLVLLLLLSPAALACCSHALWGPLLPPCCSGPAAPHPSSLPMPLPFPLPALADLTQSLPRAHSGSQPPPRTPSRPFYTRLQPHLYHTCEHSHCECSRCYSNTLTAARYPSSLI